MQNRVKTNKWPELAEIDNTSKWPKLLKMVQLVNRILKQSKTVQIVRMFTISKWTKLFRNLNNCQIDQPMCSKSEKD